MNDDLRSQWKRSHQAGQEAGRKSKWGVPVVCLTVVLVLVFRDYLRHDLNGITGTLVIVSIVAFIYWVRMKR